VYEPVTMKIKTLFAVERLTEEQYTSIVCYPRVTQAELRRRMRELQRLGIETLEFTGERQVSNIRVLGKGCVGIVVSAYKNGCRIALKIRRVDADRAKMQREARLLKKANSVHVGPRMLAVSKNFLCMQFIDGMLLPAWLSRRTSKTRIRAVLRRILDQCWRLDSINMDHGELSHAPKHVIVTRQDEAVIVDFESASLNRRPANVTSICQFLFIGSETATEIRRKLGQTDMKVVARALRYYKKDRTSESFQSLLSACGL
jgi:putative serine/threonine protein kinase